MPAGSSDKSVGACSKQIGRTHPSKSQLEFRSADLVREKRERLISGIREKSTLLNRRNFIQLLAAGLYYSLALPSSAHAKKFRPIIGAIRWDAWYDRESEPGKAVEASLGPKQYQFRAPFFARILSDHEIDIDGGRQEIIDLEIELASSGGLDYWAFDAYARESSMSKALKLYLSSPVKSKINFCLLSGLNLWGDNEMPSRVLEWHAELMSDSSYQVVAGNRPLYFLGFLDDHLIQERWHNIENTRSAVESFCGLVVSSGRSRPYIVILDNDPERAANFMTALGCDAISHYGANSNLRSAPYSTLAKEAAAAWETQSKFASIVPTIVTGTDRRPRFEHPVPWEHVKQFPGILSIYYETAKPAELRDHIISCLHWMSEKQHAVPAAAALIYAWNENDEGGWLIPTYGDGTARLKALREAIDASNVFFSDGNR